MTTTVTDPYLTSGDGGGTGPLPPTGGGGGGGGEGGGGARRRRSMLPLIIALCVGVVVAVLVAVLATSKSATDIEQEANSILIGKPAPAIQGSAFPTGTDSLANYRGKWVLVNFFASWCVPCQQEQGDLVTFQNRHTAAGDAVIFGVRFNDPDDSAIKQMMTKSGAHWPIVDDINAKFDWGVTGPPESFIVDPNGIVKAHIVGQVNADQLDNVLGRLEASGTPLTQTTRPSSAVSP
jgi:cytochrome c biogenesis protein CcmG/thiol:disulfide interchange protein DsbE